MSWEYTLERDGRWFTVNEMDEMARWIGARPTVYRRSDGAFVIARDRATRDHVVARGAADEITYTASAIVLDRATVTLGVVGYEEQAAEIAAFVAACQARGPCVLRDPDGQILTPAAFLEQQRKLRGDP